MMHPPTAVTTHYDQQDVVNHLLAAALQARAACADIVRIAALVPPDQTRAAADFTDAGTTFSRIHDMLMRAADSAAEKPPFPLG